MARAEGVGAMAVTHVHLGRDVLWSECSLDGCHSPSWNFCAVRGAEMHWSLRAVEKEWEATTASLEKAVDGEQSVGS